MINSRLILTLGKRYCYIYILIYIEENTKEFKLYMFDIFFDIFSDLF